MPNQPSSGSITRHVIKPHLLYLFKPTNVNCQFFATTHHQSSNLTVNSSVDCCCSLIVIMENFNFLWCPQFLSLIQRQRIGRGTHWGTKDVLDYHGCGIEFQVILQFKQTQGRQQPVSGSYNWLWATSCLACIKCPSKSIVISPFKNLMNLLLSLF